MASIHPPRLHPAIASVPMGCSTNCHVPSSLPPSIVAAVRITAGPLINVHIAGPKPQCVFAFPEEGVYILYQRQTLQIAKARCSHQQCSSHRCYQARNHPGLLITPIKELETSTDEYGKPCQRCLNRWLRLEEALSAVEDLGLQAVQAAPSFAWSVQSDRTVRVVHDADAGQNLSQAAQCSKQLLSLMRMAWQDYLLASPPASVPHLDTSSDTPPDNLSETTNEGWDMVGLPSLDSFSDDSSDDDPAESYDDLSSDLPYIWSYGLQLVDDERNDKTLIGVKEPELWDDTDESVFVEDDFL